MEGYDEKNTQRLLGYGKRFGPWLLAIICVVLRLQNYVHDIEGPYIVAAGSLETGSI